MLDVIYKKWIEIIDKIEEFWSVWPHSTVYRLYVLENVIELLFRTISFLHMFIMNHNS